MHSGWKVGTSFVFINALSLLQDAFKIFRDHLNAMLSRLKTTLQRRTTASRTSLAKRIVLFISLKQIAPAVKINTSAGIRKIAKLCSHFTNDRQTRANSKCSSKPFVVLNLDSFQLLTRLAEIAIHVTDRFTEP